MTQEVSQIVKLVFNSIDNTVVGVYNSNEDRTDICNTKWMKIGQVVEDSNGDNYTITNIEVDEWIEWEPLDPNNSNDLEGVITLPSPYWITGTQLAANREWTIASANLTDKLPLVWLLEVIRIKKYGDESVYLFDADVRIFFLDETNIVDFYTADHRQQVMYPMEKLCGEFIQQVGLNPTFKTLADYEIVTFSRFGSEAKEGMFKNILDANLSGVELRLNLLKYKENCKC